MLEANPVERLGQVRQSPEDRRRQDHDRWLAPGQDRLLHQPYLNGGPGGEKNWRGELTFPEETVKQMVKRVYDLGVPLNLHANGDAAIDMFLRAHEFAAAGDLTRDRRVTVIHSQFVRPDQLDKLRAVQGHAVVLHAAHLLLRRSPHRQSRQGAGELHEPDASGDRQGAAPDQPHRLRGGAARSDVHDVVGGQPRLARRPGDRAGPARQPARGA